MPETVIAEPGASVWLPMTYCFCELAVMVWVPIVRAGGGEGFNESKLACPLVLLIGG